MNQQQEEKYQDFQNSKPPTNTIPRITLGEELSMARFLDELEAKGMTYREYLEECGKEIFG